MIDPVVAFHALRPYRVVRRLLVSVLHGNRVRIRGKGNTVRILSNPWDLRRLTIDVRGDNNRIEIRSRCRISCLNIRMIGSGHCLRVEEECYITDSGLWFEDWQGCLTIGRGTSIRQAHIAVTEPGSSIRIGSDCMLADDIDISTGDGHSIIDLESKRRTNHSIDVVIGSHVWICSYVKILKGSSVGDDSILGTGAVVTGTIPANCVSVGVPARVIRTGVSWIRARIYRQVPVEGDSGPELDWAWYDRGNAARQLGALDEAIACFDRVIRLNRHHFRAWYARGLALAESGRFDEAIQHYDRAIALDPRRPWPWYDRGIALFRRDRLNEAVASLGKALRLQPEYPEAWLRRADVMARIGDYRAALRHYRIVLEFQADNPAAHYGIAVGLARLGDAEGAMHSLSRAIAAAPDIYRPKAESDSLLTSLTRQ